MLKVFVAGCKGAAHLLQVVRRMGSLAKPVRPPLGNSFVIGALGEPLTLLEGSWLNWQ